MGIQGVGGRAGRRAGATGGVLLLLVLQGAAMPEVIKLGEDWMVAGDV